MQVYISQFLLFLRFLNLFFAIVFVFFCFQHWIKNEFFLIKNLKISSLHLAIFTVSQISEFIFHIFFFPTLNKKWKNVNQKSQNFKLTSHNFECVFVSCNWKKVWIVGQKVAIFTFFIPWLKHASIIKHCMDIKLYSMIYVIKSPKMTRLERLTRLCDNIFNNAFLRSEA